MSECKLELSNCPFCGGECELMDEPPGTWIRCMCPPCEFEFERGGDDTDLVGKFNRRAQVEELRRVNAHLVDKIIELLQPPTPLEELGRSVEASFRKVSEQMSKFAAALIGGLSDE